MNQCEPVEKGSRKHYDYTRSKTIQQMRPRIVKLEYIPGTSRYDENTIKC